MSEDRHRWMDITTLGDLPARRYMCYLCSQEKVEEPPWHEPDPPEMSPRQAEQLLTGQES